MKNGNRLHSVLEFFLSFLKVSFELYTRNTNAMECLAEEMPSGATQSKSEFRVVSSVPAALEASFTSKTH